MSDEIQDACVKAALERRKLELEVRALEHAGTQCDDDSCKASLERQKLELEVRALRRTDWRKPGVAVPIVAAVVTLGLSQYLGVFDLRRERIQLENDKAQFSQQKLQRETELLQNVKDRLTAEQSDLEKAKKAAQAELTLMRQKVAEANTLAASATAAATLASNESARARANVGALRAVQYQTYARLRDNVAMTLAQAFRSCGTEVGFRPQGNVSAADSAKQLRGCLDELIDEFPEQQKLKDEDQRFLIARFKQLEPEILAANSDAYASDAARRSSPKAPGTETDALDAFHLKLDSISVARLSDMVWPDHRKFDVP